MSHSNSQMSKGDQYTYIANVKNIELYSMLENIEQILFFDYQMFIELNYLPQNWSFFNKIIESGTHSINDQKEVF